MAGIARAIARDRRRRQAELFRERQEAGRERLQLGGLSTEDAFCVLHPEWIRPEHMRPLSTMLDEAIEVGDVRGLSSVPPQHGKTETIKAAIARAIDRYPRRRHAYVTYTEDIALDVSRGVRRHVERTGRKAGDDWRGGYWSIEDGGGLVAVGVGGPLTSRPIDGLLILDDPYRDDVEASSEVYRTRVEKWISKVAMPRMHPGASLVINHTRWHPDDAIGRRTERDEVTGEIVGKRGWEYRNTPAVLDHEGWDEDEGRFRGPARALAPALRPLSWLEGQRADLDPYTWAALYEGRPIAEGEALFGQLTMGSLEHAPTEGVVVIGVDLAYTARKRSDYSAAVVMRRGEDGRAWAVYSERWQATVDESVERVRRLRERFPGARVLWRGSRLEEHGVGPLFGAAGVPLRVVPSTGDKRANALAFSSGVHGGRVVFCGDAKGFAELAGELEVFTGIGDAHDDLVDAAGTAYDGLQATGARPRVGGVRRRTSALGRWR